MKWGVRRYQNYDGTLTEAGIKRYAKKGYAEDAYNSNKSRLGKAYDKYTGAHKYAAQMKYETSSSKTNRERAERYLSDQNKKKELGSEFDKKVSQVKESMSKGEKVASTILGSVYADGYAASIASGNSKGRSVAIGLLTGKVGEKRLRDVYVSELME